MRWLQQLPFALTLGTLLLSGCGSNDTNASPACVPSCRDGFVCSRGTCVSACNPECRSGEVCVASGASFTCAPAPSDSGTPDVPADATTPEDVQTPTDGVTPPTDVPVGMDSTPPPPTDAPSTDVTTTTDTASPTDVPDGGRVPCGAAGQACCFMRACNAGTECVSNVCRAITRAMGECQHTTDCPAGQVCGGPDTCGTHGCFDCAPPVGMGAQGATCTTGANCATGLCSYGHCTVPCTVGGPGDAECRAVNANLVCAEFTYSVMSGASRVTLGTCVHACGRNGECASPEVCVPLLNYLNDRYDFICNTITAGSTRTGIAGTPCTDGSTCQSALCVPPVRGTGPGTCTAPCATDADCTPAAPVCGDLPLLRPSGAIQMSRGCMPRA